ncbi:MAG: hypothetical protein KKA68_00755, partial [Gammaproteobacteria bacterium]|nr:hypothetical protein [Gammaproteobacteria bacterium]
MKRPFLFRTNWSNLAELLTRLRQFAANQNEKTRFGVNLSGFFEDGGRRRIAGGYPAACPAGQLRCANLLPANWSNLAELLTRLRQFAANQNEKTRFG